MRAGGAVEWRRSGDGGRGVGRGQAGPWMISADGTLASPRVRSLLGRFKRSRRSQRPSTSCLCKIPPSVSPDPATNSSSSPSHFKHPLILGVYIIR